MASHIKRTVKKTGSYSFISDAEETNTAIIFVYGFLGDSQRTWEELQLHIDLLAGEPFKHADLYFWSYSAEHGFVDLLALQFREFVNDVFPNPPQALLEQPVRKLNYQVLGDLDVIRIRVARPYERLVFVGHSLGGVVIRRMIANEALGDDKDRSGAIMDADLALFAPAQLGFRPSGLKALLELAPFSSVVLKAATSYRAFADLQPDSAALSQLRRETEGLARKFRGSKALRPRTLWGEKEDVLAVGRYDTDRPKLTRIAEHQNHVSVVKLQADYLIPAEFILNATQRLKLKDEEAHVAP